MALESPIAAGRFVNKSLSPEDKNVSVITPAKSKKNPAIVKLKLINKAAIINFGKRAFIP